MSADTEFYDEWIDNLGNWFEDLFPEGHGWTGLIGCAMAAAKEFGKETPEYIKALEQCRALRFSGAGSVSTGTQFDIDTFLDDLLGGIGGSLDDLLGGLKDKLIDAVGGLGQAGVSTVGNVGDIAGAILGNVGLSSQGALDIVGLTAGTAIENVGSVLGDITGNIGESIEDFLRSIRDAIRDAINAMSQAVSRALDSAISTITRVVDGLVSSISNAVNAAIQSMTDLFNRVIDSMQSFIQSAIERIGDITDRVFQAVAETVENIRAAIVTAFDNIVAFIGEQIDAATALLNTAVENINEIGNAIVANAEQVYDTISSGIDRAISELTDTASGALASVREGLDSLSTGISTFLDGIGPILTETIVGPAQEFAEAQYKRIVGGIDEHVITLQEGMEQTLSCMGLPPEAGQKARQIMACVFPSENLGGGLLQNLLILFTGIMTATTWAGQLAQAAGIKAMQDMQPAFPIALPDPGNVLEMLRLGTVDDATATNLIVRNGFSTENAARILETKRRLPDIGMVQVWFLREFVSREDANALLQNMGFTAADAERTLDMAFFIPGAQDLITMAVREVFTPETAEKFGQFEDFPEAFAENARLQGISDEWARNYWAAHWALPSVQMGFEMLHRRVITEDELVTLLKAQDVMPFWRDKLTEISYNPLTRVDVRRMHKLGVLTNDEVRNAYKDIGYNETNAQRLLDFTIALNAPDEGDAPEVLTGLTRSAIIDLFKRGTFTRSEAAELLRTIGLGAATAETFIQVAELQTDQEEREAETQLIIDRATAGILTRAQAEDAMNALGLSAQETDRGLLALARALDKQVQLPSKSDLDKMLSANIINDATYLDTLIRLGFSPLWATRFLELTNVPARA